MLSDKIRMIVAPSIAIALVGAPVVLTGCNRGGQDVPTSDDVDNAARNQGGSNASPDTTAGGGAGTTSNPGGGDSEESSYDEDGNPIISTEGGDIVVRTSEDGSYSTSDFIEGSAIYGRKVASVTNDYQFVKDGIGDWEMVALKDGDGYVFAGDEINSTTITLTADSYGTITVNGNPSAFGWQQYRDFPQLALGDIGKQMTITMELNDNGMLTVRQDADGQVMLFKKISSGQPVEQQPVEQQPVDQQPVEQQPVDTVPVVDQAQIEGAPEAEFGE